MSGLSRTSTPRPVEVVRRRRSFGLDAPRPPDPRRLEAAVRDWLETNLPSGLVLRLEPETKAQAKASPTLLVLLPGCRVLVLELAAGTSTGRHAALRLTADCRARSIPLALVSTVDDVRGALRSLGIEPEED